LVKRGYSAAVIERSDYRSPRIGETLPPAIKQLFVRLGVWEQFLAEKHLPSFGIRSAWGANRLRDNDFIFNPYGAGWHVDRARFDEMFARCAEEGGARLYRRAKVCNLQGDDQDWKIQFSCGNRLRRLQTKFAVDATGRAAWFARKRGARRLPADRLLGVVGFFTKHSRAPSTDTSTLIEAVEHGWWYSAVLPDSRLVIAYMTDADLYATAQKQASQYWLGQLESTTHTRSRLTGYALPSSPRVVAANSFRLDRVEHGNWLAIGDAAMAFDPLSGQGIYKALQSALAGADSIERYFKGGGLALREDAVTAEQNFHRYLLARSAFYSKERRWPDSTFWRRRIS
jgi:flavin-dependent dehydrogenase